MTTPRPRFRRTPAAPITGALVLALVLAGCGGGGGGGDRAGDSGAPEPATTTTGPRTASSQPVDTTFSGRGSEEYCRLSRSYQDAQSRLGPSSSPDVRQLFQDAARDIRQAVAVAPGEIKPDVQVVADGFSALVSALDGVNYDFTKLPPDLIARFMSAEFSAASTRVAAYARNVCGIN